MPALLNCLVDPELPHAEHWLDAFTAGPDRDRILGDNWAKEPNFCHRIAEFVGIELLKVWHAADPPSPAIAAITPSDGFCALETAVADPGTALSRVMTLHTFAKFHLNASMPLTKDLRDAELLALLADLDAADLIGTLRGAHEFCWAAPTDNIGAVATADELRDTLGLPFRLAAGSPDLRRDMEWLLEISYASTTPPSLHRPTVVEAQGSAEFKPSEENSDYGWTVNLATGNPGAREYVHPSFAASLTTTPLVSRGRITSDPPLEWLDVRLKAI